MNTPMAGKVCLIHQDGRPLIWCNYRRFWDDPVSMERYLKWRILAKSNPRNGVRKWCEPLGEYVNEQDAREYWDSINAIHAAIEAARIKAEEEVRAAGAEESKNQSMTPRAIAEATASVAVERYHVFYPHRMAPKPEVADISSGGRDRNFPPLSYEDAESSSARDAKIPAQANTEASTSATGRDGDFPSVNPVSATPAHGSGRDGNIPRPFNIWASTSSVVRDRNVSPLNPEAAAWDPMSGRGGSSYSTGTPSRQMSDVSRWGNSMIDNFRDELHIGSGSFTIAGDRSSAARNYASIEVAGAQERLMKVATTRTRTRTRSRNSRGHRQFPSQDVRNYLPPGERVLPGTTSSPNPLYPGASINAPRKSSGVDEMIARITSETPRQKQQQHLPPIHTQEDKIKYSREMFETGRGFEDDGEFFNPADFIG